MSLSEAEIVATRKVVYNACFGGFSLSDAGVRLYAKIKGITLFPEVSDERFCFITYWTVPPEERQAEVKNEEWQTWPMERRAEYNRIEKEQEIGIRDFSRDDPALVEVVETLGDAASGECAKLRVAEIPADAEWHIHEYDGLEHVAENHRTWP